MTCRGEIVQYLRKIFSILLDNSLIDLPRSNLKNFGKSKDLFNFSAHLRVLVGYLSPLFFTRY